MAKFSPERRRHVAHGDHVSDDYRLAQRFVAAVERDLQGVLCAAALFGSCATNHATKLSDIDVLLVVDDVSFTITDELTEAYRLVVRGHASKTSPRLHINTLKLSSFWEYCRQGDPVIVNMLRDGQTLYDKGFLQPAQLLLQQGRIRPSKEAVWTYYSRTSHSLRSAQKHLLQACLDLYWSAMDAAHAALMSVGEIPPTPEHAPDLLERALVRKKLLGPHYPGQLRELYALQKAIMHREVSEITGEQYAHHWRETLRLVDALRTIVERHPPTP